MWMAATSNPFETQRNVTYWCSRKYENLVFWLESCDMGVSWWCHHENQLVINFLGTTVQNFAAYKRVYFELQLEYFSLAMAWKDTIIALLQIERGWVRVGLLWDKQHKTHNNIIVRKSILKWATFSSLVFIGPMLNEIQPFKNLKIYSEIYRCLEDVSGNPYISYKFSSGCIFFNIGPIDTKLQIFHNLNVLFLAMWVLCCLSNNKPTHTQPFSIKNWAMGPLSIQLPDWRLWEMLFGSRRKQPTFGSKWRLKNECRNSILMTCHYLGLNSTFDWLKQISHMAQLIRGTTLIWIVMHHQYGISALISQMSFCRETPVVVQQNVSCFLRLVAWEYMSHSSFFLFAGERSIQEWYVLLRKMILYYLEGKLQIEVLI